MDNNTIKQLMIDTYNTFFLKWRNDVPASDSEKWTEITNEVSAIMQKYGEEAYPLIMWFLEQLEKRCRG